MAKRGSKTLLAFGDVHVPHHHPVALEVLCRAAERIRPDVIVYLGDLLDCGQFSAHPPTWGMPQTEYVDDLNTACALLDRLQATCRRLVLLEGNHEYRLDRWAAAIAEGGGLAWTEKIVVRSIAGEKYDRIVGYTLGPMPEAVPIEEWADDWADLPF